MLRVCFGLVLGLGLAELGMRAWLEWLPQPKTGTYVRDPVIGYRLRPQPARGDTVGNPYHVNSFGYRDHEHTLVKPAGTRRILGIGDSFVAGEVGLEDNFLRLAEREWNDDARHSRSAVETAGRPGAASSRTDSVEVILMGLGGYGPEQYLGTLRSAGFAVHPDLVILCFYIGNDVAGVFTRHAVRRGDLYSTGSFNARLDLLRRSRLFSWLERRLFFGLRSERIRDRRSAALISAEGRPGVPPGSPSGRATNEVPSLTRLYLEVIRSRLPLYDARPSARVERLWTATEGFLDAFDRTCREAGVPWLLVLIPDEFQVDPSVRAEALRQLAGPEDALDLDGPQGRLRRWASPRRIPVLDLLNIFRDEQTRRGSLYFPNDTHWNEEGNRVAAESMVRFTESLPGIGPAIAGGPLDTVPEQSGGAGR